MIGKIGKVAAGLTLAGTLAASMLISPWEGRVYKPYKDIGGVWTVCDGITGADVVQKVYTERECDALLAKHINIHEQGLDRYLKTTPPPLVKAAFISFTFNVGVKAAGESTLVRLANQRDWVGACNQLSRWTRVKGVVVRGLENRRFRGDATRVSERTVCLAGISQDYKQPAIERAFFAYQDFIKRNRG